MKSTTDERELSECFMRFGEIVNIVHKGSYAFIEFAEPGCAEEAIKEMSTKQSEFKVQMAYSKSQAPSFQSKMTDFGSDGTLEQPTAVGKKSGAGNECYKCG